MASNNQSLVFDLNTFVADSRIKRNILSTRTGLSSDNAFVDEKTFSITAQTFETLPDLGNTQAICIYSTQPVSVTANVDTSVTPTVFPTQRVFILTCSVSSLKIENLNLVDTMVNVIRLAAPVSTTSYRIARHLVTFAALSRIAPIGSSVTTLSKVVVQDVTLALLVNDQVTAPAPGVTLKYRICNSDGTANPVGAYIMYLDDTVTQQNFSGTLQLWVAETY
jgi:hypothetical protein